MLLGNNWVDIEDAKFIIEKISVILVLEVYYANVTVTRIIRNVQNFSKWDDK